MKTQEAHINDKVSQKNVAEAVWKILESIPDPEIPVLSITDLGIVRSVQIEDAASEVVITPTYSGCPAMDMIAAGIRASLDANGFSYVHIRYSLSPAWTTEWMTASGREKLRQYGIAPPVEGHKGEKGAIFCPHCHSADVKLVSEFGSTACKALYSCNHCGEPFDYFKCH